VYLILQRNLIINNCIELNMSLEICYRKSADVCIYIFYLMYRSNQRVLFNANYVNLRKHLTNKIGVRTLIEHVGVLLSLGKANQTS
jgi:hypothetical protein